jgi:hypothetical protein
MKGNPMSNDPIPQTEIPIACTPEGVPVDKRDRWFEVGKEIYAAVEEVQELPDGYACRLPSDAATLIKAAEYISLDRLCCTFIRWSLVVEPGGGAVWLHITGAEGTKAYLRNGFETTPLLREEVAISAGFSISERAPWVHPSDPNLVLS